MDNGNNQEVGTPYIVEKGLEEKLQDFTKKLANGIPAITAFIIAIWWIFYGAVSIGKPEMTVESQVGLTICTFIFATSYYQLIADGGFKSAKKTNTYKNSTSAWSESIKKGNGKKREIILYAKDMAKENLNLNRRENLENNELVYEDFFDKNGNLINTTFTKNKYSKNNQAGYTSKQIKIIKKVIKTKITIPTIFGSLSSKYFGIKREESQKQFSTKNTLVNSIIRLVLAFISVGISFQWIGFSTESVMYALFQITLWTASAVTQRIKNYNFVIDVLVPQIVEKKLIIDGYLTLSEEEQNKYSKRVEEESKGILKVEYKKEEN